MGITNIREIEKCMEPLQDITATDVSELSDRFVTSLSDELQKRGIEKKFSIEFANYFEKLVASLTGLLCTSADVRSNLISKRMELEVDSKDWVSELVVVATPVIAQNIDSICFFEEQACPEMNSWIRNVLRMRALALALAFREITKIDVTNMYRYDAPRDLLRQFTKLGYLNLPANEMRHG